jgi:hypothetical protein
MAHWIDANVFMHAQNGLFAIDLAPSFWTWLETGLKEGALCSSTEVFAELVGGNKPKEALHLWARNRKEMPYWKDPLASEEVQKAYTEISSYVLETFGSKAPGHVSRFLAKADAWIIAQAKIEKGTVVTDELRLQSPDIPKVPNVCKRFDVPCIAFQTLLRTSRFSI